MADPHALSSPPSRAVSRSHSRRPVSRPRTSRNPSIVSVPYLPTGPAVLINPDGQIGEEAAELLQEFVHPHHHAAEDTLLAEGGEPAEGDEDEDDDGAFEAAIHEWRQSLPWWKRPSPWWFICAVPFSSMSMAMTLAPRIQIYTELACDAYKPEYTNKTLEVVGNAVNIFNRPYELCAADPDVQQAVSRLSLTMLTTMGILGCLTTGFWSSISDRYGRMRIMGFAVAGMLITDVTFIATAKYSRLLPGGMWFLLLGPFVDGCLGSYATVMAAVHAYIADTVDPAERARSFSLLIGLVFTGMSIGPTLGSLLINRTHNVLIVFYVATVAHILFALSTWFVVPESLAPIQLQQARRLHETGAAAAKKRPWFQKAFGFLAPLALLLPGAVGEGKQTNPLKKPKRDWSLFLLALANGFVLLLIGGITPKIQYMSLRFGWDSENVGYWTSIVGAARAFHLTVFLPNSTHPTPHRALRASRPIRPSAARTNATAPKRHHAHSSTFDLDLARCSIALEIIAHVLMALAHTGVLFTAWSVFGALGSGFGPSVSSVATTLYIRNGGKELGKLFGALSVVQIVCSQVVGPFLYGVTFMHTVKTFPQAVFALSIGSLTLAFILLAFIRLPKAAAADVEVPASAGGTSVPERGHLEREDTLVDTQPPLIVIEEADDEGRGRNFKADVKPADVVQA
ncbi:major facilitator superfamily domain-containing protein [Fomitopsis serialis]|uniref:major facilitator superfamily domain-containing protein n=1 Tax=Fomitopsis serialis TaxID=139415 RepID=UPI002008A4A1|nr:major facilitator superfamily domain-containing protein [Neoantrodia serialis]KAH9930705.1 major facilitator superfamily domain-containing protein [Neoantrodia serialis]